MSVEVTNMAPSAPPCVLVASPADSINAKSCEILIPVKPTDVAAVPAPEATQAPGVVFVTGPRACTHLFKAFVGSSVFMMPATIHYGGYIAGPIIMAILAIMTYDCIAMHLRCVLQADKPWIREYSDLIGFVLGARMKRINGFIIIFLGGCWLVIFFQISAGLVQDIIGVSGTYTAVVIASGLLSALFALYSNDLSSLAWVSGYSMFTAIFLSICTFGVAVNKIMTEGVNPDVTPVASVTDLVQLCSIFSCTLFGIPPLIPICLSMSPDDRPRKFPRLFRNTLIGVMALHTVYGVCGYLAYGPTLVTTTLSKLPMTWYCQALRLMLASCLLTSGPLCIVPAMIIADAACGVPPDVAPYSNRTALTLRLGACALITAVALLLGPDAMLLLSAYVGATLCVLLTYVIPVFLDLLTSFASVCADSDKDTLAYWKQLPVSLKQRSGLEQAKVVGYLVFSAAIMVIGLALAIRDTIRMAA